MVYQSYDGVGGRILESVGLQTQGVVVAGAAGVPSVPTENLREDWAGAVNAATDANGVTAWTGRIAGAKWVYTGVAPQQPQWNGSQLVFNGSNILIPDAVTEGLFNAITGTYSLVAVGTFDRGNTLFLLEVRNDAFTRVIRIGGAGGTDMNVVEQRDASQQTAGVTDDGTRKVRALTSVKNGAVKLYTGASVATIFTAENANHQGAFAANRTALGGRFNGGQTATFNIDRLLLYVNRAISADEVAEIGAAHGV